MIPIPEKSAKEVINVSKELQSIMLLEARKTTKPVPLDAGMYQLFIADTTTEVFHIA
jgi:hypothetical protein